MVVRYSDSGGASLGRSAIVINTFGFRPRVMVPAVGTGEAEMTV
jgi:hypothetical protein